MKTYFRVLAILSLIGVVAVIVWISIALFRMSGIELAGGIIALILLILVGPAEGLLFAHVASLTEDVEALKAKSKINIIKNCKFLYFKGFEVIKDFDQSIDGKHIIAGMNGRIIGENEHTYKATITIGEEKKNIAFNKNEKRVKIYEYVKTLEEVKTPNNDVIKSNKVGQIVRKNDNGEYVAEFRLDDDSIVEITIDEHNIIKK